MSLLSALSRGTLIAAGLLAGGLLPTAASAAPETVFSSAVRHSSVPSVRLYGKPVKIQTNAQGDELATWTERETWAKPEAPLPVGTHTFFSYRVPGGTWAPKVELAGDYLLGSGLTGDGSVTVASYGVEGSQYVIRIRTGDVREPVARWTSQAIEFGAGGPYAPAVLTGNGSTTSLVYGMTGEDPADDGWHGTFYATQRRGTDPFPAPQVVARHVSTSPLVAMSAAGDLAVAWDDAFVPYVHALRAVTKPAGQAPSPVREIASTPGTTQGTTPGLAEFTPTSLVATQGGGAVVGWQETVRAPGTDDYRRQAHARRVSAAGTLGPDQPVSEISTAGSTRPILAADDAGRVAAAVQLVSTPYPAPVRIQLSDAPVGGSFGPAKDLAAPATGTFADLRSVAFDPSGGLFIVSLVGQTSVADYRPAGQSTFAPRLDLFTQKALGENLVTGISGPGRISLLSSPLDPVRESGETMVVSRRSRLIEPTTADQTFPTVTIGAVTQSAKGTDGKSTLSAGFTISESASVTATLSRKQAGALVNGSCVAPPTKPSTPPAPACLRRVTVATTPSTWTTKRSGTVTFSAAPAPGTYTLAITARDAAANQGAAATGVSVN